MSNLELVSATVPPFAPGNILSQVEQGGNTRKSKSKKKGSRTKEAGSLLGDTAGLSIRFSNLVREKSTEKGILQALREDVWSEKGSRTNCS